MLRLAISDKSKEYFLRNVSIRSFECIFYFSRRRGRKHNLVFCLNCRGQLLFMNLCEPRQSCRLFSYNRRLNSKKKYFPNKFLYVYLPETCVCALKRIGQKIPRVSHLCNILNLCSRCRWLLAVAVKL